MTLGHVIVGVSGGVDSAVAAWRLQQQGYRVSGLFMVNWTEDETGYCSANEDFQSARAVCQELEIPLHRVDFSAEYRERVFRRFLEDYAAGKTPNPDLLCNREVKFQPFREHALRLGADWIATGHYARIEHTAGGPQLLRAADENKDQTYFLATVEREHFDRVLFPLGDLTKPEVRDLARRAGLPNHGRRDSTGICFIGERPFRDFLGRYLSEQAGPIEDENGQPLGRHIGLAFYTLGQRRGLAIGGQRGARQAPWYVIDKLQQRNALIVAQNPQHPRLMARALTLSGFNWLADPQRLPPLLQARIRHRQVPQDCRLSLGADSERPSVTFTQLQRAAAPGQYAVLYAGQRCVGGGEIERTCAPAPDDVADAADAHPGSPVLSPTRSGGPL